MSRKSLTGVIAEVKSDLRKLADVGLLDEISMRKDAIRAIKKLGSDITEFFDTVVEIKDGKGKVPSNFKTMYAAYMCKPYGYRTNPNVEEHMLQSSHYYVERTTYGNEWNECEEGCNIETENVIRENLYFKQDRVAEFYYNQPILLTLGKAFHKDVCHSACRNKYVRDNPNEIVIIENTIQTNFDEGSIYFMYYGLPMDGDGNITYPDDSNGVIQEYIEYAIKLNTAERLLGNGDASAISKMYPIYERRHRSSKKAARNVVQMKSLTPATFDRWHRLNQQESFRYESGLTDKSGTLYR